MGKIRNSFWISLFLLTSGCSRVAVEQPDVSVSPSAFVSIKTTPIRVTEKPLITTIEPAQTLLPPCRVNDLIIEVDTTPVPQLSTVIRIILYAKENHECQVGTQVNFRLETEDGELLPIEGNNGLAFAEGYVRSNGGGQKGVGAVWSWQNFCQKEETAIVLSGSAGGLQTRRIISVIPDCFDRKESSQIRPFITNGSSNQVIEWQGTVTPVP